MRVPASRRVERVPAQRCCDDSQVSATSLGDDSAGTEFARVFHAEKSHRRRTFSQCFNLPAACADASHLSRGVIPTLNGHARPVHCCLPDSPRIAWRVVDRSFKASILPVNPCRRELRCLHPLDNPTDRVASVRDFAQLIATRQMVRARWR